MDVIICVFCGKEVKLIRFGDGWVGQCCDKIIYNNKELPEDDRCRQTDTLTQHLIRQKSALRKKYT
jgi:hypothetical protein